MHLAKGGRLEVTHTGGIHLVDVDGEVGGPAAQPPGRCWVHVGQVSPWCGSGIDGWRQRNVAESGGATDAPNRHGALFRAEYV